jgi:5-methylcytosine-specific restriction enzyme A
MAWSSSDRRKRLPKDWPATRKRVLIRDRYQCVKCGGPANQVDHIVPSGSDDDDNLQSLCEEHHNQKSSAEGHAALRKLRAMVKGTPERPPGDIPKHQAQPRQRRGF